MTVSWQNQLLAIPKTTNINEHFYHMMTIFQEHFPCEIVQLYQYSRLNSTITGVLSYENQKVISIAHIHESMLINDYIHQHLLQDQVAFFHENEFHLSIGNQIPLSQPLQNMLLIPFSINGVVIAFMTGVNPQCEVTEESLQDLEYFREKYIHLLQLTTTNTSTQFTEKELIVMQYISNGYTTKEISASLNIAESTVKYFIKNVMQKTNSLNRTEAIAAMFRKKLID